MNKLCTLILSKIIQYNSIKWYNCNVLLGIVGIFFIKIGHVVFINIFPSTQHGNSAKRRNRNK